MLKPYILSALTITSLLFAFYTHHQAFASRIELTNENQDQFFAENDISLLLFVNSETCTKEVDEKCVTTLEMFNHASDVLVQIEKAQELGSVQTEKQAAIAIVDAVHSPAIAKNFGVVEFPQIYLYEDGRIYDYSGKLDKYEDIVAWMILKKKLDLLSISEDSCQQKIEEIRSELGENESLAILFNDLDEDETNWFNSAFQEAADKIKELDKKVFLAFATDKKCSQELSGSEAWPQVVLLRNFDKKNKILTKEEVKEKSSTEILDFLIRNTIKNYFVLTEKDLHHVVGASSPSVLTLLPAGYSKEDLKKYKRVAMKEEDEFLFSYVFQDQMDQGIEAFVNFLGLPEERPLVTVLQPIPGDIEKYIYAIDPKHDDQLYFFLQAVKQGNVDRYYKSEPEVKEEDNIGSVKYITGKQYEQNVVKASEDSDILFAITTDWCQYCGKITDIIYEISWENVEGLTVAQMDGDRNEAKGLKVEAFPTLYLYSKGKPVEEYPGVWEAEKVRAWLSQHSQAFAKHQLKKMDEAAAKQEL